jgi:hypothetical protein
MHVASILSLSNPSVSDLGPHLGASRPCWNGNVFLPFWGSKLHHLLYNPLQVIEFRVYDVVR